MSCISNISLGNLYGLACKTDGTVRGWGWNSNNQASGGNNLTNIRKVDAGMFTSIAVRNNGTITLWGSTGLFNINKANSLTNISDVSIHNDYALTLSNNGTVNVIENTFYSNPFDLPEQTGPSGQTNVTGICAGYSHSYIVYNNGNMVGFGDPVNGGSPISLSNVKSVKAGFYNFAALLNNGRITGWQPGSTSNNFISDVGITYTDFAVNGNNDVLGLKSDGTLSYWGSSPNLFTTLLTYNNVTHVAGPHGGNGFVIGTSNGLVTGFGEVTTYPNNGAYSFIPNICGVTVSSSSSSSSSNPSLSSSSSSNNNSSSSSFLNIATLRASGWGRLEGPVYDSTKNYIQEPFMSAGGRLGNITGIKKVVAGVFYNFIIFQDGRISGWSDISNTGKCYQGGPCSARINLPEVISDLNQFSNVDDAVIGINGSIIKFKNGTVRGWYGDDNMLLGSQAGNWSSPDRWNACRFLTGVKDIAMTKGIYSNIQGFAVLNNGRVTGWGAIPTFAFNYNVNGGVLISGGRNLTGVVKVDCGQNYVFALLNNGVLTGWGHPSFSTNPGCTTLGGPNCYNGILNRCAFGPIDLKSAVGLTGVKDFSCGPYWALGVILKNNKVTGFGNMRLWCQEPYVEDNGLTSLCNCGAFCCPDPSKPLMASGFALVNSLNKIPESIHIGSYNHMVKFTDGTIYGWGINDTFQDTIYDGTRNPQKANINNNTLFNVKQVSVSYENILVLYDTTVSSSSSSSNISISSSSSSFSSSSSSLDSRYAVYLNLPV